MESFDPALTEPQASTRVYRAVLAHFIDRFGEDEVARIIAEVGLSLDYLQQPEQWVSLHFGDQLNRALAERLCGSGDRPYGDPAWEEWRIAGRRSARPEIFGPLWSLGRAVGSPAAFFRAFPLIAAQANRLTRFTVMEQGRGLTVISADQSSAPPTNPAYCLSRIGLFEQAPTIWGQPRATVEHTRCIHHPHTPAEQCIYVIRYRDRPINGITMRALIAMAFAAAGGFVALDLSNPAPLLSAGLGALGGLSLERWWAHRRDQRARTQDLAILRQTLQDTSHLNQTLWSERMSLRKLLMANQKISGYLDPTLVQRIMDQPEGNLMPGGERVSVAVLFVDIVGYTTRCEASEPEQVVNDLNTFFAAIDPVIDASGGILDKRIGDAVMAVFVEHPDAAPRQARALSCAAGILRALTTCNATLVAQGSQPIRIRIGISSGSAVQGNLGSALRYEFTVIGDVVNLAARLEGLARYDQALALSQMRPWLPDGLVVVDEDAVTVKGRAAEVGVMHLALAGDSAS